MLIPFGVLSAAGAGVVGGAYELIATEILTTSEASITFSNLGDYSSIYKHLQIRCVSNGTSSHRNRLRLNGDTASNYATHLLFGTGSSVLSDGAGSQTQIALVAGGNTANQFAAGVIDILDAYSTTKNKTVRSLGGSSGTTDEIILSSGVRINTESITSVNIRPDAGDYIAGSRFSLYGIKG